MLKRSFDIFDSNLGSGLFLDEVDTSHRESCACAECLGGGDKIEGSGVPQAEDTVPGDATSTATATVGGYISGSIDSATDSDWYRITLVAGQTYTFSTILASGLSDSVLRLRDATGALIAENDDAISGSSFLFSEIRYTATTSGAFFLDVTGFGGATGTFFLTSTAPVADSIAESSATTATLTLGAAATSGTLEANGDHDWFAVQLVAGQTYLFTTNPTGGADIDTTLMLRNASGTLLAYNDDSAGTLSRIRFTATTSGTYYLDLGAWANNESGAYRVQAMVAPPLELYTSDQIANQLTTTYWGGTQRRWNVQPGGTITVNITALTAPAQALAREALLLWTDSTGITFSEVATGGQMTFDDAEPGAFASSTVSGGIISSARINVSETWLTTSGSTLRSYTFQAFIHEIGHALGLGHGGNYNSAADYEQDASYLNDSWATTIMSYFDQTENTYFSGQGFTRQVTVTPLVADIVATTSLYGAVTTTRTGNSTYGVGNSTGRASFDATAASAPLTITIIDNGGIDTLDYSVYSAAQRIDLNPESFSNVGGRTGNLSIARGTLIENAVGGTGSDTLVGNSADNRLDGGAGVDQLYGGVGNDVFVVDQQADVVFEGLNEGVDRVESSGNFYLYANIENLTLTGSVGIFGVGNDLDNILTGNSGENLLIAHGGNDTVNGGDARDSIFGMIGNDILNGDGGIDIIFGGDGSDTIDGGADPDEIYGDAGDDIIRGGTTFDTDIISGGLGNDTIFGNSGLGDYDIMAGNQGDDIYYVDTPHDQTNELAGEGTDTVFADVNGTGYFLNANVENLNLLGLTPFGVGNDLGNRINGSAAINWIYGRGGNDFINGGAGNDVLFGEGGADTFIFDRATGGDVIADFERGIDKIDLTAFGPMTFAQLQSRFAQDGTIGAIQFATGEVVVLHNIIMTQLTAADFIFATAFEPQKFSDAPDVMDVGKAFVNADASGSAAFVSDPALLDNIGLDRWGAVRSDFWV
jgi:serralysin